MHLFNWSVDEILMMPAIRFFALLEEGRKQKMRAELLNYLALCDVQSISLGNAEYFEKLKKTFYDRLNGIEGRLPNALDPTDPLTVHLIENLTLEASRVN